MPITYPTNPTVNQTYTHLGVTWTYTGKRWIKSGSSGIAVIGYNGSTGYAGSTGYTGSTALGYTGSASTVAGYTGSAAAGGGASTPSAVSDQQNSSNGAFALPVGNTAQRPVTAYNGYTRFNTNTLALELYYNTVWNSLAYAAPGYSAANPATSATQLTTYGISVNGSYWINIGGTAMQCYVDFALAGGPYILVMVAASTGTTYDYDSTVWTNTSGGVTTALDPTSDTNQVHSAFYQLSTTRTGMAMYQPASTYFHYLDHTAGTARANANSATPPTAITPNGTTIAANNIIPATSPARALGWWNSVTAAGLTAATNGSTYYRYGYAHGTPDPSQFGYLRFGWTADQDPSDSRDRGMGMGLKNAGGGPVASFSASCGRWDYNDGSTAYKNNLKGYLYIKN